MKSKSLPVLIAVALLLSQAPVTFAQSTSSNWHAVEQIKTDAKLIVKQKDGKEIKGRMIEANDTTLTIDRNGKPFSIARTDVRQIYVTTGRAEKGKWSAIGAGIGAGAGTGIGAIKFHRQRRQRDQCHDGTADRNWCGRRQWFVIRTE